MNQKLNKEAIIGYTLLGKLVVMSDDELGSANMIVSSYIHDPLSCISIVGKQNVILSHKLVLVRTANFYKIESND